MTTSDPDYVNAVVRGDLPDRTTSYICVFCDRCGDEHNADYIVGVEDDSATRLGYARARMRGEGWRCGSTGDLCPECIPAEVVSPK